jgi:hypothetical protein
MNSHGSEISELENNSAPTQTNGVAVIPINTRQFTEVRDSINAEITAAATASDFVGFNPGQISKIRSLDKEIASIYNSVIGAGKGESASGNGTAKAGAKSSALPGTTATGTAASATAASTTSASGAASASPSSGANAANAGLGWHAAGIFGVALGMAAL